MTIFNIGLGECWPDTCGNPTISTPFCCCSYIAKCNFPQHGIIYEALKNDSLKQVLLKVDEKFQTCWRILDHKLIVSIIFELQNNAKLIKATQVTTVHLMLSPSLKYND
eukprot:Platyproteum_vivax@DN5812_c0_g1_i2.p1